MSRPEPNVEDASSAELVVVGAHLSGMPLHHQLTELGAALVREARTEPVYRLYALDTEPPKPGLIRVGEGGASIEVEVYRLSNEALGCFMQKVPAPLCIGRVSLSDKSSPLGFLCEPFAVRGARDITEFGGWRAFCEAPRSA